MRTTLKITLLCLLAAGTSAGVAQGEACGAALVTAEDGLCDAYCEGLDCDGTPEGTVETCVAVFDAHKKLAGTAPPCEADLVCPCLAAFPAFANLIQDAPNQIASCASAGGRGRAIGNVEVVADVEALTCSVIHGNGSTETLGVTYEEAGACLARVEAAAAAAGQACS